MDSTRVALWNVTKSDYVKMHEWCKEYISEQRATPYDTLTEYRRWSFNYYEENERSVVDAWFYCQYDAMSFKLAWM